MAVDKKQYIYIFNQAKFRYRELRDVDIDLRFNNGWFFTMRAGIVPSSIFNRFLIREENIL